MEWKAELVVGSPLGRRPAGGEPEVWYPDCSGCGGPLEIALEIAPAI